MGLAWRYPLSPQPAGLLVLEFPCYFRQRFERSPDLPPSPPTMPRLPPKPVTDASSPGPFSACNPLPVTANGRTYSLGLDSDHFPRCRKKDFGRLGQSEERADFFPMHRSNPPRDIVATRAQLSGINLEFGGSYFALLNAAERLASLRPRFRPAKSTQESEEENASANPLQMNTIQSIADLVSGKGFPAFLQESR